MKAIRLGFRPAAVSSACLASTSLLVIIEADVEVVRIVGRLALLAAHYGEDEILLVAQHDERVTARRIGCEAEEALEEGGKRRNVRRRQIEMLQSHRSVPVQGERTDETISYAEAAAGLTR